MNISWFLFIFHSSNFIAFSNKILRYLHALNFTFPKNIEPFIISTGFELSKSIQHIPVFIKRFSQRINFKKYFHALSVFAQFIINCFFNVFLFVSGLLLCTVMSVVQTVHQMWYSRVFLIKYVKVLFNLELFKQLQR